MTTTAAPSAAPDCVATTDADGLQLIPGSADLKATGVVLAGTGCGGVPPSSNYQATVSAAPTNPQVNGQVSVTWQGGPDATSCVYGRPNSNVSGWNAGAVACSSAQACSTLHQELVTVTAAGTPIVFGIVCTNASGASGVSNVVTATGAPPPMPSPANFPLTVTSTVAPSVPFQVTWSVQNATSCTGSATLNNAAVSLPGWTGSVSVSPPASVTATTLGTYALTLVCSNASGSITSQAAQVTVANVAACAGPPGLTRLLASNITYGAQGGTPRVGMNVTEWDNVWGHATNSDPLTPWPGSTAGPSPNLKSFTDYNFVAIHFRTPATLSPTMNGYFTHPTYGPGEAADMTISKVCGDFSPNVANSGCNSVGIPAGDQTFVRWWTKTTNPGYYCSLQPNTDYYVNIKLTDPTVHTDKCPPGNCPLSVVHRYGQ